MRLADLRVDTRDAAMVATLRGDVDLSNAEELRDDLRAMMPNNAHRLVLDLSEVEYLDSAGIHLIQRLREELRARGQTLRLVIPADSVINDTLRLAGLDWAGDVVEDLGAA